MRPKKVNLWTPQIQDYDPNLSGFDVSINCPSSKKRTACNVSVEL